MIPRSSEAPLALAQRRCTMPGCKYFDFQGRSPSLCDAHYNFMLGQQVAGPAAPGSTSPPAANAFSAHFIAPPPPAMPGLQHQRLDSIGSDLMKLVGDGAAQLLGGPPAAMQVCLPLARAIAGVSGHVRLEHVDFTTQVKDIYATVIEPVLDANDFDDGHRPVWFEKGIPLLQLIAINPLLGKINKVICVSCLPKIPTC